MNTIQWAIFSIIILLLFAKAPKAGAFILFVSYCFYNQFIIDLDATYYYSCTALLNLVTGMALQHTNKPAAICSYTLVISSVPGYFLWYNYYPPDIYDNIALSILVIQLILIIPKGLFNGFGDAIKYIMVKPVNFDSPKTRVTMYKNKQTKESKK